MRPQVINTAFVDMSAQLPAARGNVGQEAVETPATMRLSSTIITVSRAPPCCRRTEPGCAALSGVFAVRYLLTLCALLPTPLAVRRLRRRGEHRGGSGGASMAIENLKISRGFGEPSFARACGARVA